MDRARLGRATLEIALARLGLGHGVGGELVFAEDDLKVALVGDLSRGGERVFANANFL